MDTSKERAAFNRGRLFQFERMKKDRPIDPCYWDMHEEKALRELARAEQSTETPPTRVCAECDGDGCAKCDPIGTIRKVCNGEIQINSGEDEDLDAVLKYIESILPLAEAPRPVEKETK